MVEGVTHISLPTQEYDRGRQEKTNRRTNTNKLGVNQEQRKVCNTRCMCIPDSIYGLTLAWVTSENSTMLLESDSSWLTVAGTLSHAASPLCCPAATSAVRLSLFQPQLPSARSRRQLSFASPYHFRIRRDFMSKNLVSGFAPKQTRLLWRPTPIVLHLFLIYVQLI